MADLVGLTEKVFQGTTLRIISAIEEEAKLKARVQQDLVFITHEFQMMQAFLNVANAEGANNEVVQTWVSQLRDVAIDVEDCVDFVDHLDDKPAWWWRAVPSCIRNLVLPALQLDEAADELMLLRATVKELRHRNTCYNVNLITDSVSKLVSPAEQPATVSACIPVFHILREVWEAAEKNRGLGVDDLHKLIASDDSDLHVISVWSSAGGDLGATSILSKAYRDPEIRKEFKNRAWVKLMHPFNPIEFRKSLLAQFYPDEFLENLHQVNYFMEQANKERYLIILEEVSTVVECDAIRKYLPDSKNGSRIVVSTRQLEIALLCTGEPYQVSELRRSTDGQSLCAFFKGFVRRHDMDKLISKLRRPGLISAWGTYYGDKIELVGRVYKGIKNKEFPEVNFEKHIWIELNSEYPFNLQDFAHTLLEHNSEDPYKKIDKALKKTEQQEIIEGCVKLIHESKCLIVIVGPGSMDDCDRIEAALLTKPTESCLVAITKNKKSRMEEARDWTNKNILFGRKDETKSLQDRLRRKMTLISVWGIPGVGKSALVRSIYYKRMLKLKTDDDFVMFSWVDVPDQFTLTDLSRRLFLDFHSDNHQAKEAAAIGIMEGQDPIQECCKILCQHRCLIVIDGLRSEHDWDLIKDAFLSEIQTTKGCIVVITNEKKAAVHVVRNVPGSKGLKVECLQADAARSLFEKVSQEHTNVLTRQDMAWLSRLTKARSGGLPKIIDALGKELGSATNAWHAHNILNNYRILDGSRGLFSGLQSYSVKPCIYLSVFPVGKGIRWRRLVTRWIAEGYSSEDWNSSRGRYGRTADENGEKIFSDLEMSSIIQKSRASTVCQVNGFFHEYIISQPMEDTLIFALKERCNLNSRRTVQHLTIWSNWVRDMNVFESIDITQLRSLTVFGEWKSFLISEKMKRLRVLDLEDASGVTDEDLKQILKVLTRLKFLSLRGCKGITHLRDSLDDMRQLQTLDVRHTSIVLLPPGICKLVTLQYIRAGNTEPWYEGDGMVTIQAAIDEDWITTPLSSEADNGGYIRAGNTEPWYEGDGMVTIQPAIDEDWITTPLSSEADNGGVEVPTWIGDLFFCGRTVIGNLTALHTLGVVNVSGAGGKALLKAIKDGKLTQLRRLKVSGINSGNIRHFFSAISGHDHLESLSVRLGEDVQDDIIQPLPPQKTLRTLKLYGNVLNLPVWFNKFHGLKLWDIEMTVTTGEDLRPLEELVKKRILRRLCVKLIQDDDLQLDMPNHQSSNFQNLQIDCSSKLKVTFGESKLVKVLKVRCSSGSDLRFSGLENLKFLEEVWLMGDCGHTFKQELKQQLSKHPKKNKLVLKLVRPRSY